MYKCFCECDKQYIDATSSLLSVIAKKYQIILKGESLKYKKMFNIFGRIIILLRKVTQKSLRKKLALKTKIFI